ncbi:hypothetical protein HBH53_136260 [Parastagonospora nodorum]|nr:hypothetical protein HBH53_136260 [Parastagonospora nodorum]KAH4037708.1 hypothetical protein HBI09_057860 [Parastagonospora nodorum]KAH4065614.1 hypothetical protein HBH50_158890 [Parastagonospora nodorum]KAH4092104.1 hypothetical protein HBH48_081950 [Parastagonospora nodorum]KAH4174195.1 hypothetical protein HBH43_073040 [Parastagonospora nodorum]
MSDNENNEGGEGEMVTKPFKFVTGEFYIPTTKDNELITPRHSWLRRALPQPEPDQALLAELRRLPQVHHRQGRGLCSLPPVHVGIPVPLPQRLDYTMGRAARGRNLPPQTRPVDSDCERGMEWTGLEGILESGIGGAENVYHIYRQWQYSSDSRIFLLMLVLVTCVDDDKACVGRSTCADKKTEISATTLSLAFMVRSCSRCEALH